LIGEGAFAVVKSCRRTNPTTHSSEALAIKIIPKAKLCDIKQATNLNSEIACMRSLQQQHAGTLRLVDVLHSDTFLYLVMEHHGRDLFDVCSNQSAPEEKQTVAMMRKVTLAVAEVHAGGVAHRDVKPENLLINNELNVKLCDYGLATHYRQGETLRQFCGSKGFFCPELLMREDIQYDGFKVGMHHSDFQAQRVFYLSYHTRCPPYVVYAPPHHTTRYQH
jgi:serine/threonine protein kinase